MQPSILFLIDENVPESVTEFLRQRGHDVRHVRDLALTETPDPIIAAAADKLGAVVVTWNHRDFKKLLSRVPQAGQPVMRRAGRINFRCNESQGRYRVEQVIDVIEFEYELAQRRPDKRLLIEVLKDSFRFIR
jgi:predicted nuclease of predicted toxin-antitoxin system